MASKKRNKKYNPTRLSRTLTDRALAGMGVACLPNAQQDASCVYLDTGKPIHLDKLKAHRLITGKFKWSVYMAILCRDTLGNNYIKGEEMQCKQEYAHSDLADLLNDHHQTLLKSSNKNHLVMTAWIASPFTQDISSESAYTIFEEMGAWDYSAKWEIQ